MDEGTAVVTTDATEIPTPPQKFDLATLILPFTPKQKEFLVLAALGETYETCKELTGISAKTWQNWRGKEDFKGALDRIQMEAGLSTANQASQLYLGGVSLKVLDDIKDMASKDWKDCKTSYEYTAKQKCMDIVQRSQGWSPPDTNTNVNIEWAENINMLLQGGG